VSINTSWAQKVNKKIIVSGFVTDINHNPVAGAMIFINKNNTNNVTNRKGFYKVKINPDAELITISSSDNGFGEALIEGRTTINITLDRSTSSQNITQDRSGTKGTVNIGYGSIDQKDLTTPVNRINGRDKKYASYINIYEILRSIPGVQISGNNSITIQGQGSLNFSAEPLFVVDGVIVNSINDIPPTQVKSIEVLKGPSATIYGSRGANGVILINLTDAANRK